MAAYGNSMLPNLSQEQYIICRDVWNGHNVVVQAVAGSGKTTTLLHICKTMANSRIVILTYNKKLQVDTERRVMELGLRVGVYTIHAAAGRSYGKRGCVPDDKSLDTYKNCTIVPCDVTQADIILIDEVQDLTPIIMTFIFKLKPRQFVLVGDPKQCIYKFMGACDDYIKYPDRYFNTTSGYKFINRRLTTSYRLTPAIAKFVSTHILGDRDGAVSIVFGNTTSKNIKPKLVRMRDEWNVHTIYKDIKSKIIEYGIDNVVMITYSTKVNVNKKSPFSMLINKLQNEGIGIYRSQEESIDDNERHGKFLISTVQAFKGREAKVVFIYNLDHYYINNICRNEHYIGLPNTVYVAYTRALTEIIVYIEKASNFPTWDHNCLNTDANIIGEFEQSKENVKLEERNHGIIDILKHRNVNDVIAMHVLYDNRGTLSYPTMGCNKDDLLIQYTDTHSRRETMMVGNSEDAEPRKLLNSVANLYGIVIPIIAEMKLTCQIHCNLKYRLINVLIMYLNSKINKGNIDTIQKSIFHIKNYVSDMDLNGILDCYTKYINEYGYDKVEDTYDDIRNESLSHILDVLKCLVFASMDNYDEIGNMLFYIECLSDIWTRPYMSDIYGNFNLNQGGFTWYRHRIIKEASDNVVMFIGHRNCIDLKFEVPLSIICHHPALKGLAYLHDPDPKSGIRIVENSQPKIYKIKVYEISGDLISYASVHSSIEGNMIETLYPYKFDNGRVNIGGRMDALCKIEGVNVCIEFKFRLSDDKEDLLQLATYISISEDINYGYLYNCNTGRVDMIYMNDSQKEEFMKILVRKVDNWQNLNSKINVTRSYDNVCNYYDIDDIYSSLKRDKKERKKIRNR